jgi:hypothetical protein
MPTSGPGASTVGSTRGRPRFGPPQMDSVWKGVCKAEETVQQRRVVNGTAFEVDSYFRGPLDGGDGARLQRGTLVHRDTGAALSTDLKQSQSLVASTRSTGAGRPFNPNNSTIPSSSVERSNAPSNAAPPSTEARTALIPKKAIGANPTSNGSYGWFQVNGQETRGNGDPSKYFGLKKGNLFS